MRAVSVSRMNIAPQSLDSSPEFPHSSSGVTHNQKFRYNPRSEGGGLEVDWFPDKDASIHTIKVIVRASADGLRNAIPHRRSWTYTNWNIKNQQIEWLLLDLGEGGVAECCFNCQNGRAIVRLSTPDRIMGIETVQALLKKFKHPRRNRSNPEFQVLCRDGMGDMEFHNVSIPRKWRCKGNDLNLLYGKHFESWAEEIGGSLTGDESGIVLLSGEPGTGKTCFLRHLIASYSRKVDFIYLPPIFFASAASPEIITTWVRRNMRNERPTALIIEDAEDLLVDGNEQGGRTTATSNLLNATDGLLGDVLKAKIICSFNCSIHRIDRALIRPGRLKAAWKFEKLGRSQAECVRERFDLPQLSGPGPFSLAEIFRDKPLGWETPGQEEKTIGFAA